MGLIVVSLVAGVSVGWLLGGRLTRLAAVRFRGWRLLLAAAAAQLVGSVLTGRVYAAGLVVSAALASAFLARNRRLPGILLIAGGLLLNAVVVAANGAMPVSRPAAVSAGVDLSPILAGADPRHQVAEVDTRFAAFGDVLAVRLPFRPEVASPGDVAVALGLAVLVVAGMRRAPRPYRPGLRSVPRPAAERTTPGASPELRHWTATAPATHGRIDHGETLTQAQGPGQEQGQSRQEAQRLTRGGRPAGPPGPVGPVPTTALVGPELRGPQIDGTDLDTYLAQPDDEPVT